MKIWTASGSRARTCCAPCQSISRMQVASLVELRFSTTLRRVPQRLPKTFACLDEFVGCSQPFELVTLDEVVVAPVLLALARLRVVQETENPTDGRLRMSSLQQAGLAGARGRRDDVQVTRASTRGDCTGLARGNEETKGRFPFVSFRR